MRLVNQQLDSTRAPQNKMKQKKIITQLITGACKFFKQRSNASSTSVASLHESRRRRFFSWLFIFVFLFVLEIGAVTICSGSRRKMS